MKHPVTVLFALLIMFSCNDEERATNCQPIEAFESQDFENNGQKFKYEFNFNNGILFQTDRSMLINDVYHLFYSFLYQYDSQNHLIRVDKKMADNRFSYFTELTYSNDLLVGYVMRSSSTSLPIEERTILYNTDNTIDRVNYALFKNDETLPFDSFYCKLSYADKKVIISYFDIQDQFTGSVEASISTLPIANLPLTLIFDRYYTYPLYLLTKVPTQLVLKDPDGSIVKTFTYSNTMEGGLIKNLTLDQGGIRNDLFEFNYSCN